MHYLLVTVCHLRKQEAHAHYRWHCSFLPVEVSRFSLGFQIAGLLIVCFSGNGLVSYYINLVLEGVGVTATNTKAMINGFLQVCIPTW
jgi:hypothetical protein